jgi:vacuolar-type H+-ATPase subunit I/STV1
MSSAIEFYEALTSAPDERTRARVIAEALERLEDRYPHLPDLATHGHLRETELTLQKEIEQVRAELTEKIEQVRAELKTDIERLRAELKTDIDQVRADLRATELRLQKEIEQVRGEIVRTKLDLLKWIVPLMLGQVIAIAALVKLL